MTAFVVGRSDSGEVVSVGPDYKNVSRRHLECSLVDGGRFRIVDLGSANGTEVLNGDKWERVKKAVIGLDQKLRLGREFETTPRQLIAMSKSAVPVGATRVFDAPEPAPQPAAERTYLGDQDRGYSSRILQVRGICHTCGKSVKGEFCEGCGARLVSDPKGIIGVVAQDLFRFGEGEPLLPRLLMLLYSPVRATLALALDPSFRLHQAMFALGTVVYLGWSRVLAAINPTPDFTQTLPPKLRLLASFSDLIATIAVYMTFVISFVIGYYVFCDYSKSPRKPRDYLKLCCISFLVSVVAFVLLTAPGVLGQLGAIGAKFAAWLTLVAALGWLVFQIRYMVLTTTHFWGISPVSAFRGLIVAFMMASVVTFVIAFAIALVFGIVTLPFR